nr:hypothetical protein [Tanacetum cinerariifolium]
MTLEEYLSMNPRRKVGYRRVNEDSDEDEYDRLPPLRPCFQTPQPCTTLDSIPYNSSDEADIDNMSLEEDERYEVAKLKRKSKVDIDNMAIEEYELYMLVQCS